VSKERLYRPDDKLYWEGYIHEELTRRSAKDCPRAKSRIRLDHLANLRSPERNTIKRQMYSWMLFRLYKHEVPRRGVSSFGFNEYVPKHLGQIEADAKAFAAINSKAKR